MKKKRALTDVVTNWPQPFARPGYIQGVQTGVFAETPNRIFVLNRGEIKASRETAGHIQWLVGLPRGAGEKPQGGTA